MKFLEEKGIKLPFWKTDKMEERYELDIETYGVDPRECFSLDYAFALWLYPRLIVYKRDASTMINMNYERVEIDDVVRSEEWCIDKMVELLEKFLKDEYNMTDEDAMLNEFMNIFSKCWRFLWWYENI
jgi:hypothetical protein